MYRVTTTVTGPDDKLFFIDQLGVKVFYGARYVDINKRFSFLASLPGILAAENSVIDYGVYSFDLIFDTEENARNGMAIHWPDAVFLDKPGKVAYEQANGIIRTITFSPV
jgi:hypothetical protein